MAANIPQDVLNQQPPIKGLKLRNRGKVRDSHLLPEDGKLLMYASDRVSIFDFVMNAIIPLKGEILTALSYFWVKHIISHICNTDLVAIGAGIDEHIPRFLRGNPGLQARSTIVNLVEQPQYEDVVRMFLTGSGWTSYQKTGAICGHKLPPGLTDGSELPYPIYTPTTKADIGHDEPVSADIVGNLYGLGRERLSLQVAQAMASFARSRGIILADTKLEFSSGNGSGLVLADEKGTPDSSRFWDLAAWKKAHASGQLPPSFDKQYVREWGRKAFIDADPEGRKRDPQNPADVEYVHNQIIPAEVIRKTTNLYRYIFWRLTGKQIDVFQNAEMAINVAHKKPRIEIVVGSENDLKQMQIGLSSLVGIANARVSVISCHRNPDELRAFVKDEITKADVVIAGAGKAAALPGDIKSELCALRRSDIPVIGVAFKSNNEKDDTAAMLAIECVPGEPVELDPKGRAYLGCEGFFQACRSAVNDEFLPKETGKKPAQIGIKLIS